MATCKNCNHFNACSKWTDFPNQCGVPVCARFEEKSAWISVDERLPEKDGKYLVYDLGQHRGVSTEEIRITHFKSGDRYHDYMWKNCFSHWMPLPEPPKGE